MQFSGEPVPELGLRFADLFGAWQHFSLPLGELEVDSFVNGLGFDGSSIRGWQACGPGRDRTTKTLRRAIRSVRIESGRAHAVPGRTRASAPACRPP